MKRKFGGRHNSVNSPTYQKYAAALDAKLAERYKGYDNIVAWHISNEYGGVCYCENCEKKFREWLKDKYKTIDEVNRVWDTAFWGHTFYTLRISRHPTCLLSTLTMTARCFRASLWTTAALIRKVF